MRVTTSATWWACWWRGARARSSAAPDRALHLWPRFASILAALANAIILLVAVGAIALEATQRFVTPEPVAGKTVMIVAAIGIIINTFTAWLFMAGRKDDLNVRGAFLHMAADAAISLGVVIAGAAMLLTGWQWADPAGQHRHFRGDRMGHLGLA